MTSRYAYTVLVLVVAANFTQVGSRLMIGAVVPDVMGTFTVSKSVVGLALSGMWATYAAFQFPSGVLGDRFGERTVIVAALVLTGIGGFLIAIAPTFVLFGLFAVFLGAGAGLFFPVATGLLTDMFENTGQAVGVLTAGGAFSGLIAPVVAASVAVQYGWRAALALIVVATFVVVAVFAWRVRPDGDQSDRAYDWPTPARVRSLLFQPSILYSAGVATVAVFTFQSVTSFLPTFFIEFHGFSTQTAGIAYGGVFLLAALAQPVAGRLSDIVGRDSILSINTLAAALGLGLLLFASPRIGAVLAVASLGIGLSWAGVMQVRIIDHLPEDDQNVGFGVVRTSYMFLGALGSMITGSIAEFLGWRAAFGVIIVLLLLAATSLLGNRLLGTRL